MTILDTAAPSAAALHLPPGRPVPLSFPPAVLLSKAEVFGACQALADADRLLLRCGGTREAAALGDLFELLERRLAVAAAPGQPSTGAVSDPSGL